MFRSDWDLVSPSSWLTDFADEEAFVSGRDVDIFGQPTAATMLILLPETTTTPSQPTRRGGRRGRRQQPQQAQAQQPASGQSEKKTQQAAQGGGSKEMDHAARTREKLLTEDFFADLPLGARAFETQLPATLAPPPAMTKDGYAYLTYAYSACATLDDTGETVESTRRRYEDSAGVLKAVHRRQIGDRAVESTWLKTSDKDDGTHDKRVVSGPGDAQEFERAWCATPFGVAEKHALEHGEKTQTELPDAPPPQEIP